MPLRKFAYVVTGVDVGGTTIAIGLFEVSREGKLVKLLLHREMPTFHGKPAEFYDKLAQLILQAQKIGEESGLKSLPLIGVGQPGRFILKNSRKVIAPESAGNLGRSSHDFDFTDPEHEIENRINQRTFLTNDAVAKMNAALCDLLSKNKTRSMLLGKKIAYIGAGTGLGGGFAFVRRDGEIQFFTDGHIYDLVLGAKEIVFNLRLEGRRFSLKLPPYAEDVFSGRATSFIAAEIDKQFHFPDERQPFVSLADAMYVQVSAKFLDERILLAVPEVSVASDAKKRIIPAKKIARRIAQFEGEMATKIIEQIFLGKIKKRRNDAHWPKRDILAVRGITNWIIGGKMATKGVFGKIIVETIKKCLARRFPGLRFNLFVLYKDEGAGLRGAALLIPQKEIIKAIKSRNP